MKELWTRLPLIERLLWAGAVLLLVLGVAIAVLLAATGGNAILPAAGGLFGTVVLAGAALVFRHVRLGSQDQLDTIVNQELDKKWKPGLNKVRGLNIYE